MNRSNITVVLVEPENPGNIGSVCRAMKNMGFERLILVNPCDYKTTEEASNLAWSAKDVLHKAAVVTSLQDALSGHHYCVAFSRRLGKEKTSVSILPDEAPRIAEISACASVCLVFGRESKGLSNDEARLCHTVCEIPSSKAFASLNLSQAVMTVCYELYSRFGHKEKRHHGKLDLAPHEEVELMFSHITEVLSLIGYSKKGDKDLPSHIMKNLRRMTGRSMLEKGDVDTIRGICSQVQKALRAQKG